MLNCAFNKDGEVPWHYAEAHTPFRLTDDGPFLTIYWCMEHREAALQYIEEIKEKWPM